MGDAASARLLAVDGPPTGVKIAFPDLCGINTGFRWIILRAGVFQV